MRFACLILLIAPALAGATHADLSGEWRWTASDDPQYSQPDFDDQTWQKVTLPRGERVRLRSRDWVESEYFWIRRTVDVNISGSEEPLALTFGAFREAYEVFVNGVRVGATGPFDPRTIGVARPRTFVLPPQVRGPRLVIAIRMWNPILQGWRGLLISDTGPWLLTPVSLAPRDIGLAAIDRRRVDRTADLVQSVIVLVLCVIVLLIWAYDRSRRELLWLGLYLVLVGGSRLHNYTLLSLESHPYWLAHWKQFVVMAILPAALLAQFAAASLNIRWIVAPTWITVLAGIAGVAWNGAGRDVDPSIWIIDAFTLVGLVLACRPASHTGLWRGTPRLVLAASIAFCLYTHASGWGRIERLGLPVLSLIQWPFAFSSHMMTLAVLSFGFSLVLVQRLLRDRDEKVRLTGEVEAARTVQQLLLPAAPAVSRCYETHAIYEPAQEVGGDFHWSRVTADETLLAVVGDVSGKGLKAAMLVSVAVGVLRNEKSDSPAQILAALNESLVGNTGGGFVTCCCARFRTDGSVTVANAGHPSPYLAGAELATEAGLPLGIDGAASYEERTVAIGPGEQLTLVSDGVVEAANPNGELFGFERTLGASTKSAQEIADAAKAWGQNDDITVVTVRRTNA